ncbi:hypothetical protein D9758_014123 [Tetrapyrgos nigripes]|uniref:Proteophosphoglycan ppg4 n=1 Tax=Tetrapyrgos nigripes TaxID=182062 RepID=A0A8H5FJ27_9AGAR|nr:hypothetical protein D9758_014123 [Tetrapyrgos nigripes]
MLCFSYYDLRSSLYNNFPIMNPSTLFILALSWSSAVTVIAAPTTKDGQERAFLDGTTRRATHDGDGTPESDSSTTRIWVPIVVVVLVVIGVFAFILAKRGSNFTQYFARAAGNETGVPVTRELTAAQLAGSTNNVTNTTTTTTATTGGDAASRTRRPRRPRRTPSQISTTSLPAYMKEPGEQELVVIRGPTDMEDVLLHAVEMPSVTEDEDSVNSRYSPMPHSPTDMPLLHNDDERREGDAETPAAPAQPRTSGEMGSRSDESTSSLARVDTMRTDEIDPRGATPSYFEAVDLGEDRIAVPVTTASPETSPTASNPASSTTTSNRRSTFRLSNLFTRGGTIRGSTNPPPGLPSVSSSVPPVPPIPGPSHNRGSSGGALSLTSTLSRQSIFPGHRPSQSNGSLLSLVRKKSNATLNSNHLNSPSMISLNSISAPLTHTLMRTEFTYPKSGPTPEQLKLISSRDSFARFGMPYGEDAIAYASSSRADLNDPPPEFEASESSPRPGSRLRVASPEVGGSGNDESSGHGHSGIVERGEAGQAQNSDTALGAGADHAIIQVQAATPAGSPKIPIASLPTDSAAPASSASATSTTALALATSDATSPKAQAADASGSSDSSSSPSSGTASTSTIESTDASSSAASSSSSPPSSAPTPSSKAPASPSPATPAPQSKSLSSKPSSTPKPIVPYAAATISYSSRTPPTSFKAPNDSSTPNYPYPESRAESRASSFRSVQSFATAQESLGGAGVSEYNEFGELVSGMSGTESESESVYHSEYLSGDDTETERDSDQETVDEGSRPRTPTLRREQGMATGTGAGTTRHLAEGTDSTVRAAT